MSKVSSKINKIKKKLDSISGLSDDFIISNKEQIYIRYKKLKKYERSLNDEQ